MQFPSFRVWQFLSSDIPDDHGVALARRVLAVSKAKAVGVQIQSQRRQLLRLTPQFLQPPAVSHFWDQPATTIHEAFQFLLGRFKPKQSGRLLKKPISKKQVRFFKDSLTHVRLFSSKLLRQPRLRGRQHKPSSIPSWPFRRLLLFNY